MESLWGRLEPAGYALLRFVAGFLFAFHGMEKLFGMFGGTAQHFPSQLWWAGAIELVAGTLIAVGLLSGWFAFLASGSMAVAYFQAHQPHGFWPVQNRGELAALYCFVFLYVSMRGSGPYSIDALQGRGTRR